MSKANKDKASEPEAAREDTLLPASATENLDAPDPATSDQPDMEELDADEVFARLSSLKGGENEGDERE